MSLVQINAIREIIADAEQRLLALGPPALPGPTPPALTRARAQATTLAAEVARLEEQQAKIVADTGGAQDP